MSTAVNTWTPDLNKLLRKWNRQLAKRQGAHIKLSIKYIRRHYYIGIPSIMVSTAVSTGILSTFKNSEDPDTQIADQYTRLVIGIVGIAGAMLSALQTFMEYQKLAEAHKIAADMYETLYRDIDTIIQVPSTIRGDPLELITSIRERYDEIRKKSPQLVDYDLDLSYEVYKDPGTSIPVNSIPGSSDKTSDRQDKNIDSRNIDSKNLEGSSTTSKSIREQIDQLNEHDTSDEDKKVCIQLDIDSYRPVHNPTNRLKRDLYRPSRPKIDNSLRFELDRLEHHMAHDRTRSLEEMVNDITLTDMTKHRRLHTVPIKGDMHIHRDVMDDIPRLESIV